MYAISHYLVLSTLPVEQIEKLRTSTETLMGDGATQNALLAALQNSLVRHACRQNDICLSGCNFISPSYTQITAGAA